MQVYREIHLHFFCALARLLDCGWMVVYAHDLEEAEEKFENGEYVIEPED